MRSTMAIPPLARPSEHNPSAGRGGSPAPPGARAPRSGHPARRSPYDHGSPGLPHGIGGLLRVRPAAQRIGPDAEQEAHAGESRAPRHLQRIPAHQAPGPGSGMGSRFRRSFGLDAPKAEPPERRRQHAIRQPETGWRLMGGGLSGRKRAGPGPQSEGVTAGLVSGIPRRVILRDHEAGRGAEERDAECGLPEPRARPPGCSGHGSIAIELRMPKTISYASMERPTAARTKPCQYASTRDSSAARPSGLSAMRKT